MRRELKLVGLVAFGLVVWFLPLVLSLWTYVASMVILGLVVRLTYPPHILMVTRTGKPVLTHIALACFQTLLTYGVWHLVNFIAS